MQGISPGYPGLTCLPSVACPATGSGGPSGQPPPRRIGSPRSFAAGRERQPSRTSIAPFVKQCLAGPSAYSARASQGRSLREGKRKPPEESGGKRKSRRLPIFPGRFQPSILGASGLNCRVRDGNGCTPTAIDTNYGNTACAMFRLGLLPETGSPCWTRTNDISVNSRTLYQLS